MEKNLFIINTEKKFIQINPEFESKQITVKELYSDLMDIFDEPEFMRYDLPIEPTEDGKFKLINGWTLSDKAKEYIDGELE